MIYNTERKDISNTNKTINNNTGSCLSKFIKLHPFLFYGIIIGVTVILVATVSLCVVLTKEEKEETSNTDVPETIPKTTPITSNTDMSETIPTTSNIDIPKTTPFTSNTDVPKTTPIDSNAENPEIIPTTFIEEIQEIFPLDENSNLEVMNIYDNINENDDGTLAEFCEYLSQNANNLKDEQKVYLSYYWVTQNIKYSLDTGPDPENYFKLRKTKCSGYSYLFKKLLTCMDYPESKVKIIDGCGKGDDYSPFEEAEVNHTWNAVEINGKWCLIDTTWDAGGTSNFYLCTPPRCFVRDHLPKNEEDQFLENPISLEKFHQSLENAKGFCKYKIEIIEDKTIQNICGKGKVIIKFLDNTDSPDNHLIVGSFSDYRVASQYQNLPPPAFFLNRIENGFEIDISVNDQGTFAISMGMRDPSPSTSFGAIYFKCDQEPAEKIYYPTMMLGYYDSNMKIISPMQRDLTKGQRYNFEIESNDLEEILISIGGESFPMTKEGNLFKEDNVYIHGGYVYISTGDTTLLSYKTIGDDVDYPTYYNNLLKPRLIQPLTSKLSKGQEYIFELKCETIENIKIIIQNSQINEELTKEDNIYKKTITIDPSTTETNLIIKYINNTKIYKLYEYTIE